MSRGAEAVDLLKSQISAHLITCNRLHLKSTSSLENVKESNEVFRKTTLADRNELFGFYFFVLFFQRL